jgi:urease accessory protein
MFRIESLKSPDSGKSTVSQLQYRHIGAIVALVLISLLSSLTGTPTYHAISNCWEGLVWGLADPVLRLDHLAGILAIGLLSAGVVSGLGIRISFVVFTILGMIVYLSPLNLTNTQIAIAISIIACGAMLVMPTRLNWLAIATVGVIAGLFQGYVNGEAMVDLGILTIITYMLGIIFTQTMLVTCAKEIGTIMGMGEINHIWPQIIRLAGLGFLAIGIVFFGNSII